MIGWNGSDGPRPQVLPAAVTTHHIAVLLDTDHARAVRLLWDRLEQRYGLQGVRRVPIPHLSLYAGELPPGAGSHEPLAALAGLTPPFRVRAHGFVIFAGDHPDDLSLGVLVARSARLSRLQDSVRAACSPTDQAVDGQFAPDVWTPHITLADRDVTPAALGRVIGSLAARPHPSWSIVVDNLACIADGPGGVEVSWRHALQGTEDARGA